MAELPYVKTKDGATLELHANHFAPLLEIVRAAKNAAVVAKTPQYDHRVLREIEHRLESALRVSLGSSVRG